jgi:hypothetical protein
VVQKVISAVRTGKVNSVLNKNEQLVGQGEIPVNLFSVFIQEK